MERYISIDNAIKIVTKAMEYGEYKKIIDVSNALYEAPDADVVEVVRCRDCAVPHNKWTGCPNLNGLIPPPDFYCAKGERTMKC